MAQQTAGSLKSKALNDLKSGKLPQALKKAQLGVKKFPKDADFHAVAGFVLTEMNRYKQSIPHFVEAAKMKPDDPQFAENLANALMQTGQIPRALAYAEKKLEQFPNSNELIRVRDEIQLKGQNWRMIIEYASKKLESDPDNAKLLSSRGRAYEQIGFVEQSSDDIARAYDIAPEDIDIALQKAIYLHQTGDTVGSAALLGTIRRKEPLHAATLFQLSFLATDAQLDELIAATEQAISESGHTDSILEFARARLIAKRDGLPAAMPYLGIANAAQHDTNPYDFASEEKRYERICEMFPEEVSARSCESESAPRPIFVIGQPRSGTTLMEVMLSSSGEIAGCGELTLGADLSQPWVEQDQNFDSDAAREFAQEYRKLMPPIPEGSTAFVDKMPHNYQRVGFLLQAFPAAKVINMLRDPRDVGLSKWMRRFSAPGMRYASNQSSIAHSANLYRKYMAHWDQIFDDRILTIQYEELVRDPETHSRTLSEFCGITWHEHMIRPEDNAGQVRTASLDQVRNKISDKSVGGWRAVADHLQPMLDGFDPHLWPEYDLS